jgi:hypothetical protein
LGYSSDARYIDKVLEMKEQQAKAQILAAEGLDVMLIPVVLGSAGTRFDML